MYGLSSFVCLHAERIVYYFLYCSFRGVGSIRTWLSACSVQVLAVQVQRGKRSRLKCEPAAGDQP